MQRRQASFRWDAGLGINFLASSSNPSQMWGTCNVWADCFLVDPGFRALQGAPPWIQGLEFPGALPWVQGSESPGDFPWIQGLESPGDLPWIQGLESPGVLLQIQGSETRELFLL